jgi:hypothetical protein
MKGVIMGGIGDWSSCTRWLYSPFSVQLADEKTGVDALAIVSWTRWGVIDCSMVCPNRLYRGSRSP